MAPNNIVLLAWRVNFVQPELKPETVLSLQAVKVAVVELAEHQNHRRLFLEHNSKLLLEFGFPGDFHTDPLLSDPPVWRVHEEPGSIKVLVFAKQILVRDPKYAVVTKLVVQLLLRFWSKFLRTIAPGAFPITPLAFAPRIPKSISNVLKEKSVCLLAEV